MKETAKSSTNQVSALHKFTSSLGVSCFDFGAGVEGKIDAFYRDLGIEYAPYDVYNRDLHTNSLSVGVLFRNGLDVVTCANVLNVVPDGDLLRETSNLQNLTKHTNHKLCFVSVYYDPKLAKNRTTSYGGYQRNEPLAWYLPLLRKNFSSVRKVKNFLACVL